MKHTSPRTGTLRRRHGARPAVLVALALFTTTAVAACGASEDASSASGKHLEKVTIQLQVPENGIFTPMWFGKSEGIYAEHGIDLTIKPGVSSQASSDAAARGAVDFTTSSFPSVVLNQAAGNSIVGLAEVIRGGNQGVLVSADSGISSWGDLPGKNVIVTTGSSQKPLFDAALEAAKVDPKSVKITNVNPTVLNQVFASGQSDGILTVFPFSEPAVAQKRKVKPLSFSDAGVEMPGFFIISAEKYVKKNPDLTRRFVEATLASWAEAYEHQDEAVAAMLKSNPALNKEDAGAIFKAFTKDGCGVDDNGTWFGDFTQNELDNGLKTLVDSGLVKERAVDLGKGFPRDAVDGVSSTNQHDCENFGSGS